MSDLLVALRAVAEITRLRILAIVNGNELTVSEIIYILGQSQPRVSRHLKLLCDSGMLSRSQEGTWVFHRVSDSGHAKKLAQFIISMIDKSESVFAQDQERLNQIKLTNSARATEYFTKNASNWDQIRKMTASDNDVESKLIACCLLKKPKLLVDLGTGTGRILEILSSHVDKGVGIDLSREMLVVARSKLSTSNITNCTVRQGDISQLTIAPESVDFVTIHHVLHYMGNPQKIIAEAARILVPSGSLVIVDFLPHDLEVLREKHAHRRLGFAKETLVQWAKQYNMTLEKFETLSGVEETQSPLKTGFWVIKKN